MRGLAGPTHSDAYHLGINWRFGNSTLYGIYNYGKDDGRSAWATADAKASHYGVAYFYDFSRRTAALCGGCFHRQQRPGTYEPVSSRLRDRLHDRVWRRCALPSSGHPP